MANGACGGGPFHLDGDLTAQSCFSLQGKAVLIIDHVRSIPVEDGIEYHANVVADALETTLARLRVSNGGGRTSMKSGVGHRAGKRGTHDRRRPRVLGQRIGGFDHP